MKTVIFLNVTDTKLTTHGFNWNEVAVKPFNVKTKTYACSIGYTDHPQDEETTYVSPIRVFDSTFAKEEGGTIYKHLTELIKTNCEIDTENEVVIHIKDQELYSLSKGFLDSGITQANKISEKPLREAWSALESILDPSYSPLNIKIIMHDEGANAAQAYGFSICDIIHEFNTLPYKVVSEDNPTKYYKPKLVLSGLMAFNNL